MLYFTIFEQSKRGGDIVVHDGTVGSIMDESLSVSKQLTIMYQYSIYEEGVDWADLSKNITEQEFNVLYDKGQRIFWLETDYEIFTVKIEEWETMQQFAKANVQLKKDSSLFDDLKIYCSNFVRGFYNFDEFKKLVLAYEDLEKDRSNNLPQNSQIFALKIAAIENEIELRQGQRMGE